MAGDHPDEILPESVAKPTNGSTTDGSAGRGNAPASDADVNTNDIDKKGNDFTKSGASDISVSDPGLANDDIADTSRLAAGDDIPTESGDETPTEGTCPSCKYNGDEQWACNHWYSFGKNMFCASRGKIFS